LLIVFGICLILVRRHYTKLLDVANKRAQKSQQLKSVFIDNISRTLRSPLQVIDGFCNMILDEKDEVKASKKNAIKVKEYIENKFPHSNVEVVAMLYDIEDGEVSIL
jgi:signal transduction histidine kinase